MKRLLSDYPDLLELQKKNSVQNIGKVYLTDQKCAEFTGYSSKSQNWQMI